MTFYAHRLFIAGRSGHDLEATASPLHVRRGSDGSCSLTAVGAGRSSLDPFSVQGLSQVGILVPRESESWDIIFDSLCRTVIVKSMKWIP